MFTEERRADPECQPRQRGKDHIWALHLGQRLGKRRGGPGSEDGLGFQET